MAHRRRRWPWAAALAVGGLVSYVVIARGDAIRIGLEADLEKAKLEASDAITATEASVRKVAAQGEELLKLSGLDEEVDRLRRELKIKPKVITTIKWKTAPKKTDAEVADLIDWDEILGEDVGDTDWSCCDIEAIKAALPKPRLYVQGAVAELRTKLGNQFVVGNVEVWREAETGDVLILSAPWEADATDYLTVVRKPRYRMLGWYSGVGWSPNSSSAYYQGEGLESDKTFGVELGGSFRPRWRWVKGAQLLFGWDSLAEGLELKVVHHRQAKGAG